MIVPNAAVTVTRQDVVINPYLRAQINIYAGDSASGGNRGDVEGNMTVRPGTDVVEGDIITIIKWPPTNVLPPFTRFTAGVASELGRPARNRVIPLYGGRRLG